MQVSLEQALEFEKKGIVKKGSGYRYDVLGVVDGSANDSKFVEYHVDSFEDSLETEQDVCTLFERHTDARKYGGNLLVRMGDVWPGETRPLLIVGQDECIFKQYQFRDGHWVTPSGKAALIPKDEGAGVMVSGFQCREFGMVYTDDILQEDWMKINLFRRGKHYQDREAAVKSLGKSNKQDIHSSPFLVYFNYGANEQGYWTYDHMVAQLEDCVDVIKVLHPHFDILFLVDHSCGHDRQRPDGLKASALNRSFEKKQPHMHPTLIEREDGFLGEFERDLKVGDLQLLSYPADCPNELGPYWMTMPEREARRNNCTDPTKTEKTIRNKAKLSKALVAAGVEHPKNMKYRPMQKLAK